MQSFTFQEFDPETISHIYHIDDKINVWQFVHLRQTTKISALKGLYKNPIEFFFLIWYQDKYIFFSYVGGRKYIFLEKWQDIMFFLRLN